MLWYLDYRHSVIKLSFLAKLLLSVLDNLSKRDVMIILRVKCYDSRR